MKGKLTRKRRRDEEDKRIKLQTVIMPRELLTLEELRVFNQFNVEIKPTLIISVLSSAGSGFVVFP